MRAKSLSLLSGTHVEEMSRLGTALNVARRRRRWSVRSAAERLGMSTATLLRVEKGDPAVALGIYWLGLSVYGYDAVLRQLGDTAVDVEGQQLERGRLAKRGRAESAATYEF